MREMDSRADLAKELQARPDRQTMCFTVPVDSLALLDALGHRTSEVYDFCVRFPGMILPSIGEKTKAMPYNFSDVEFYPGTEKKKFPGSLKRCRVNTTYYKDKADGKLLIPSGDRGAISFHSEVTIDFTGQLCAESRDELGFWQQIGNRANHQWDCLCNAMAAADVKGIRYWPRPGEVEVTTQQKTKPKTKKVKRARW